MSKRRERTGLGRGLSALMADIEPQADLAVDAGTSGGARNTQRIPVEQVRANPDQPRRVFSQEALDELAASIVAKGIIQPLIVRPDPKDGALYQIVAGERRWRAAQIAQLHEIPVIIREFDDTEVLEVAIIENIQRADLNALDEAAGYRQLMDRFGHTQEQLATAMGKSRSHIANLLRLLTLPDPVQAMLGDGRLSAGQARALITAEDPTALAHQIIAKGLSVREVERLVKSADSAKDAKPKVKTKPAKDADTVALERDIAVNLGMPVSIDHDGPGQKGRLTIQYKSLEELDDLMRVLSANG